MEAREDDKLGRSLLLYIARPQDTELLCRFVPGPQRRAQRGRLFSAKGAAYSAQKGRLFSAPGASYSVGRLPSPGRAGDGSRERPRVPSRGPHVFVALHMPSGIQSYELYLVISVGAGPLEMQLSEGQIVVQD